MDIETLAKHLLLSKSLLIGGIKHKLIEVEVYCRCLFHDDPYVHSCKEQLQYGKFYFHRHSNGTFKGGNYKGIDITFGDGTMYFAVLIRSIMTPSGMIEGPCKVVDYILQQYGVSTVNEFVDPQFKLPIQTKGVSLSTSHVLDVFVNHRQLHLVDSDIDTQNATLKPVYVGPRVGLNPSTDAYWCNVLYRYTTSDKLKRLRNQLTLLDLTL
jgi:hypothetical protein